jgi:hypothetical protein
LSERDATRGDDAGGRVGLFLCRCAGNLGRIVGVEELGRADRWPGVAFAGVHDLL